jgi:hypothetical protein
MGQRHFSKVEERTEETRHQVILLTNRPMKSNIDKILKDAPATMGSVFDPGYRPWVVLLQTIEFMFHFVLGVDL